MKWVKQLIANIHYKYFAKYKLQDTKHMKCNGDALVTGNTWLFTPSTSSVPTDKKELKRWLSWKGKRVEVAERKPRAYDDGEHLHLPLKFTVLDDAMLDNTDYVGIHQLWSGGHSYPKYFAFLKRKNGGIEFQVRQCSVISDNDPNPALTYSRAVDIKLGKEYELNVMIDIDNVSDLEPNGRMYVSIDGVTLLDKVCFTGDSKELEEKFGCYCKSIVVGSYKPMLKVKIKRNWLNPWS